MCFSALLVTKILYMLSRCVPLSCLETVWSMSARHTQCFHRSLKTSGGRVFETNSLKEASNSRAANKLKPLFFKDSLNTLEVEQWITTIEKIFQVTDIYSRPEIDLLQ